MVLAPSPLSSSARRRRSPGHPASPPLSPPHPRLPIPHLYSHVYHPPFLPTCSPSSRPSFHLHRVVRSARALLLPSGRARSPSPPLSTALPSLTALSAGGPPLPPSAPAPPPPLIHRPPPHSIRHLHSSWDSHHHTHFTLATAALSHALNAPPARPYTLSQLYQSPHPISSPRPHPGRPSLTNPHLVTSVHHPCPSDSSHSPPPLATSPFLSPSSENHTHPSFPLPIAAPPCLPGLNRTSAEPSRRAITPPSTPRSRGPIHLSSPPLIPRVALTPSILLPPPPPPDEVLAPHTPPLPLGSRYQLLSPPVPLPVSPALIFPIKPRSCPSPGCLSPANLALVQYAVPGPQSRQRRRAQPGPWALLCLHRSPRPHPPSHYALIPLPPGGATTSSLHKVTHFSPSAHRPPLSAPRWSPPYDSSASSQSAPCRCCLSLIPIRSPPPSRSPPVRPSLPSPLPLSLRAPSPSPLPSHHPLPTPKRPPPPPPAPPSPLPPPPPSFLPLVGADRRRAERGPGRGSNRESRWSGAPRASPAAPSRCSGSTPAPETRAPQTLPPFSCRAGSCRHRAEADRRYAAPSGGSVRWECTTAGPGVRWRRRSGRRRPRRRSAGRRAGLRRSTADRLRRGSRGLAGGPGPRPVARRSRGRAR